MRHPNSISTKLGLIFISFALLVLVSVAFTSWSLNAQQLDAVVINLAGRQRMLLQQITRLALEIETRNDPLLVGQLVDSQKTFEQTLYALRYGGAAPYSSTQEIMIPAATSAEILAQIERVESSWTSFKEELAVITGSSHRSAEFSRSLQVTLTKAGPLLEQVEGLVHLFETNASHKVNNLRILQLGFLILAILLLVYGFWAIDHSFLSPVQSLVEAARRIGAGRLEIPVDVHGDDEINLLSATMDDTRIKLQTSQAELRAWGETLEQRVQQRTQELDALQSVSQEITSHLDIKQVLDSIVEKSRLLLKADVAFLCLLDDEQKALRLQTNNGPWQAVANTITSAEAEWSKGVISEEKAMCSHDGACQGACGIVAEPYRRSQLAASLSINKKVVGALCVASRHESFFSREDGALLTRLSNIAAIAIENARLYTQLERSAMLEERQRIAADMHDGLVQTLTFLGIKTEEVQNHLEDENLHLAQASLARMREGLTQAASDLRQAIASLQDELPPQYTLQEQVETMLQELDDGRVLLVWQNQAKLPVILERQHADQVLRILREALINAKKYSQASQIKVSFKLVDGLASLHISDNGIGIIAQEKTQEDDRPHFGIKIMQARAEHLGGKLEIHSQPGQGTRVVLSWPLKENHRDG